MTTVKKMLECVEKPSYRSTFLGTVDRGNVHGKEARVWISVMEAVDSVAQFPFQVLNQRLARAQQGCPLEQTHLCFLYTNRQTIYFYTLKCFFIFVKYFSMNMQ